MQNTYSTTEYAPFKVPIANRCRTAMTDPPTVASTLNDVTRRLDHVVQEEYGSAYLDSFKLTFTKKLRRYSHQNFQDVTTAIVRCLSCS
ncbi:hypothetical protein HPB48_000734 [Haemaphysalis longicornis]|uniref:Uncharacterized protein n=1 Tax=Haemaphysalis longicornis TaxID=44386 RepID=A0A9J6GXF0_HAELO|nr:hypothetical protein HPB48_000734 [Haemaphysalis longicornis]